MNSEVVHVEPAAPSPLFSLDDVTGVQTSVVLLFVFQTGYIVVCVSNWLLIAY